MPSTNRRGGGRRSPSSRQAAVIGGPSTGQLGGTPPNSRMATSGSPLATTTLRASISPEVVRTWTTPGRAGSVLTHVTASGCQVTPASCATRQVASTRDCQPPSR